ncbi:MAG: hypothetical protein OEL76_08475 [Siculibacillus sp.]|nr:hypothetical protein [Siculibacillus sp.]
MHIVIASLSALLGAIAGWLGLALLVIAITGPGLDGGGAMSAIFFIGPIGGLVGLAAGLWLFRKIGIVRPKAGDPAARGPAEVSRPFAAVVSVVSLVLLWWVWAELL